MRKFIFSLPGPISYCSCKKNCSSLELEHIVPKKELKSRAMSIKLALHDPHNLHTCCRKLNLYKGCSILKRGMFEEYNGKLARTFLYMNDKYDLKYSSHLISLWKTLSLEEAPQISEIKRNEIIKGYYGYSNLYIEKYPLTFHN